MSEQSLGVAAANSEMPEGNSASQEGGKIKEKEGKKSQTQFYKQIVKTSGRKQIVQNRMAVFCTIPITNSFQKGLEGIFIIV